MIGTRVWKALGDDLHDLGLNSDVIPQPQAHLRGGYGEYYKKCFDICSKSE